MTAEEAHDLLEELELLARRSELLASARRAAVDAGEDVYVTGLDKATEASARALAGVRAKLLAAFPEGA